MNYLSVCSGIEAATVAWHPIGWSAVAFSEIEKFPSQVLAHHYPDVPNWGNMNNFKEWPDADVDILVGGTPCQSFSVAGLRKGLDDPRGNLMLTYLAIAAKYRPRWVLWENVPGVLSSSGGRDFATFLRGLAECGYGYAYRILDAQFVRTHGHPRAVPQRRRRVFVVGYIGNWHSAAAVLFERHSLQGHPPPSREKREGVAPKISARTKGGGGLGTDFDCDGGLIANCLRAKPSASHRADSETYVAHSLRADGFDASEEAVARGAFQVRRLTPLCCEFLQGFPRNYTLIPFTHGKPAADGPRYKALGNSMAVNCMEWLGKRIQMVDEIMQEEIAA